MKNGVPDKWTISWKEAMKREHECQKKVKTPQLLFGNSGPPSTESKESPPKDDIGEGIDLQNDNFRADDVQTSSQKFKSDVPLKQSSVTNCPPSLQNQQLLEKGCLQQSQSQQNSQSLEDKDSITRERLGQQAFMFQPYWCHFCMVNCVTDVNFILHLHGNKHRTNMSQSRQNPQPFSVPREKLGQQTSMSQQYWCHFCLVNFTSEVNFTLHLHGQKHRLNVQAFESKKNSLLEKGVAWCDECNIPCMSIHSLALHRKGKKHQACTEILVKHEVSGAGAEIAITNA